MINPLMLPSDHEVAALAHARGLDGVRWKHPYRSAPRSSCDRVGEEGGAMPPVRVHRDEEGELSALLKAVNEARSEMASERRQISGAALNLAARRSFLDALEQYASALASAGRPLPYQLRDELQLYRLVSRSPYT